MEKLLFHIKVSNPLTDIEKSFNKPDPTVPALTDHDIMKFFIILMFIEHVIVLFKMYIEEVIEDSPKFVEKKASKVQHEMEKMKRIQKDNENQKKI